MKSFFTILLSAVILSSASATVHTITCQDAPYHFLPVTVNAVVGDTIHWTWIEGGHITGPINASYIPVGAAMWLADIDVSHLTFDYVVTVAGNYHYVCHPASSHGEDAYIVVSPSSNVPKINYPHTMNAPNPNPFSYSTTLTTDKALIDATLSVYNSVGQLVQQTNDVSGQVITLFREHLPNGLYYLQIREGETIITTSKIVIADY